MIVNSRAIYNFNRALNIIISPYSQTEQIKESELILKQLRLLPEYRLLVSQYLNNQNYCQNETEKKLQFVLLQLRKMTPIYNDFIWWHIVEFYFSCRQKMIDLVIDIIHQQTFKNLMDETQMQPDYSFVQFFRNPINSDCIGFNQISRMITLSLRILEILKQVVNHEFMNQNQRKKWVVSCEFLLQYMSKLFQKTNGQSAVFTQQMIIIIIYLAKMLQRVGHQKKQLAMTNQFIRLTPEKELYSFCTPFSYFLIMATQENQNCLLQNITEDLFSQILSDLLKQSKTSSNKMIIAIKNQLIVQKLNERHYGLMEVYWKVILKVFHFYLMNIAQRGNSQWSKIINYVIENDFYFRKRLRQNEKQEIQQQLSEKQDQIGCQFDNKFVILIECIKIVQEKLENLLLKESEISVIVVSSLAGPDFQPWPCSCEIILSYFHKCLHHNTHQPQENLFYCLLYAWRFFSNNPPHHEILNFCYGVLDIRIAFPSLQNICDQVMATLIPSILTVLQTSQMQDLTQLMISNAQQNQMDRTSHTYLPILIILQNSGILSDMIDDKKMLNVCLNVIDHLLQQRSIEEENPSEFSNFQIFYKLASIFATYMDHIFDHESKMQDQNGINLTNQNNDSRTQIFQILNLMQKYTFRNALYTPHTGILYVYYLILDKTGFHNAVGGLLQNMADFGFWTKLDIQDCIFYCTIVIRLEQELIKINNQYAFTSIWDKVSHYLTYVLDDLLQNQQKQTKINLLNKFCTEIQNCQTILKCNSLPNSPFFSFKLILAQKYSEQQIVHEFFN